MRRKARILNRRERRRITTVIFIFSWLFLGVGYAYLNNNLTVSKAVNLANVSWNIYFDNIVIKEEKANVVLPATIKDKTSLDMNISLEKPGDIYSLNVDIVNTGEIDAILSEINKKNLTEKQQEYLDYTVKYINNKDLNVNDKLPRNSRSTINITIKYKEQTVKTEDEELDLSLSLNYLQSS